MEQSKQRKRTKDNRTKDNHESEFSYKTWGTFPTDDKQASADAGLHDLRSDRVSRRDPRPFEVVGLTFGQRCEALLRSLRVGAALSP